MSRRRVRVECLAVALLAIVVTVPFVDVLFSDARFFVRDLTRYYYPTKKILRETVLAGEFPYWNRYYSAGQPMAANPEYEVFYPPQWLILLPDYDLGYRLHVLVHIYLVAFGTYALLRRMRLRIVASLFGAIAFAVGGVVLSYVNLLPILFAVAWIPWIAWSLVGALDAEAPSRIALCGLFLGLQALVGEPTTIVQTWALALLAGSWLGWIRGRWKGLGRALVVVGIVLAIGFAGGAVQLLTAADHVGDSARARDFSLGLVTTWSMHPARPLELFAPHVFGHLFGDRTYWGSGMYRGTASPFIYSFYGGVLLTVFAIAFLTTRFTGRWFALLLLSGSYFLSIGEHTPLFNLLYDIGVRSIRYPEKFFFPALFAIVLLGAMGCDRFLRRDRVVRRIAVALLLALTALSGVFCVVAFSPLAGPIFEALWGIRGEARLDQVIALAREDWIVSLIRCALFCLLLHVAFRVRGSVWRLAALVLLLLDLTPVGVGVLPRVDRSFFESPPLALELEGDRSEYRLFHEVDWYGRGKTARKYFGDGGRAYWVVRNGLFPMTPATAGIRTVLERDYDKTTLLPTVDLVSAMWQVRDSGQPRWREIFGAMSNVRYRASYRPFEEESERAGGDAREIRPVELIEMEAAPRYYLAEQIERLGRREEFATRLVRETFPAGVAFVELDSFVPAGGRVVSADESANDARIVVEAEGRTLLVASVTNHRYWSATVNGDSVPIVPVNLAYQGIVLERGRHEVVLRYRNPLVLPLGIVSLLTLLGCAVFALLPHVRARSRTITA